jgi:uncharacterized protein YbcV (DUF1398 family)
MEFSNAIKSAYDTAMKEKAKYPQLAKLLIQAGVRFYVVDVSNGNTTYYGNGMHSHTGGPERKISKNFSKEKAISALRLTQEGKTNYLQFLDGIAEAGIQTYLADLENARVIYIGHGEAYEEEIPAI